jgi:hypothetical protein
MSMFKNLPRMSGPTDSSSSAWPSHERSMLPDCTSPAFRTTRIVIPLRSAPNSLKHLVQFVAQFDDCFEGHTLLPSGARHLNHFWKHALCGSPAAISEPLYRRSTDVYSPVRWARRCSTRIKSFSPPLFPREQNATYGARDVAHVGSCRPWRMYETGDAGRHYRMASRMPW